MRIVVTGASGFVGRALTRRLADLGHEVLALSRRQGPGLLTVADYRDCPAGEVLVHLAQEADRARFNQAGEAAVMATVAQFEDLLAQPWQQVVYASSGAVYGDGCATPRRPDAATNKGNPYIRCKLACEALVLHHQGLVARLANLYGPGMSRASVLADILAQIPGTGPLRLKDVSPVRDFLQVNDAACGLATLAESAGTGIFNLGSGLGMRIGELAGLALELAGEDDRQVVSTEPGSRPSWNLLDITATTERFGWRPQLSLREGLAELLSLKSSSNMHVDRKDILS